MNTWRRLPRTGSALRRVLPGKDHAFFRRAIHRSAEMEAGKGLTADEVLALLLGRYRSKLSESQVLEISRGLDRDIGQTTAHDFGDAA